MTDNSLIARLERLKKDVKATALIDEAIASLKALYGHAKYVQFAANTAMISDPAKE